MFEFLAPALVMGSLVALMTAPLGCLVVWRRMAYFGDTMAHSGLLGAALAVFFELNFTLGITATAIILSILLYFLSQNKELAQDTLLGVLSSGSLALGLILLGLMPNNGVNVDSLLFGDILLVDWQQCLYLGVLAVVVLSTLTYMWRALVADSIHHDLARAEGISRKRTSLILMIMLAVVIAMAVKVVGILLITSLLIVPAAAARHVSKSPESMVFLAMIIGVVSVITGVFGSFILDTQTGPSIALVAVIIFITSYASTASQRK
jgi:zinc transport system permease protein